MRRSAAVLFPAAAALVLAAVADGHRTATLRFSFRTYAKNVKVVAPLVGPWQLGTATLRGSGTLGDGQLSGTIVDSTDPLYARYPSGSMRAHVVAYSWTGGAHGAYNKITLTVEIDSATSGGPRCDPGVRGIVTIYDSKAPLSSNGQPSDYVVMGHWTGSRCPTFVQGWTNEDGGPRTSPARGGPPHGGQWAVVDISVS